VRRPALFVAAALAAALSACGVDARIDRAEEAVREGRLADAEGGYRYVLERAPEHPAALYGLGWVYLQSGDADRALEYFKRCARVAPEDYRGHRGMGSALLQKEQLPLAEEHLKRAQGLAPDGPERAAVLNSLGLIESARGQHGAAHARFQEAAALDPARGEYRVNLATALFSMDRHEDALRAVDEALSGALVEPRFRAQGLVLRAQILMSMTVDRVDPERCEQTLPPVLIYLDRADRALEQAEAIAPDLPALPVVRRRVGSRRSVNSEACPSGPAGG